MHIHTHATALAILSPRWKPGYATATDKRVYSPRIQIKLNWWSFQSSDYWDNVSTSDLKVAASIDMFNWMITSIFQLPLQPQRIYKLHHPALMKCTSQYQPTTEISQGRNFWTYSRSKRASVKCDSREDDNVSKCRVKRQPKNYGNRSSGHYFPGKGIAHNLTSNDGRTRLDPDVLCSTNN